ncbi:uncharacterized protein LOC110017121 [Oryzias latipes]
MPTFSGLLSRSISTSPLTSGRGSRSDRAYGKMATGAEGSPHQHQRRKALLHGLEDQKRHRKSFRAVNRCSREKVQRTQNIIENQPRSRGEKSDQVQVHLSVC